MTRLRLTSTGDLVPVGQPRHRDPDRRARSSAAHQQLRAQVLAEEPTCAECGSPLDPHMDHIVPVSRGGARLSRANVRRLCGACNLSKGARLIGQGGVAIDGTGSAPRPPASLAMRTGSEIHAAAS